MSSSRKATSRKSPTTVGLTRSKILNRLEQRDLLDDEEQAEQAARRRRGESEPELLTDKDFEAAKAIFAEGISYDDDEEKQKKEGLKQDEIKKKSPEEVFKEIDVDGSGLIEFEEFKELLPLIGINLTEAKAWRYFRFLDTDKSGALGLDEFKAAMYACDPNSGNSIGFVPTGNLSPKDAFAMFDEDNSGRISEDEFVDILEYLDIHVSQAKQEKFFKKYDTDKSGYIEYSEFRKIWLHLGDIRGELERRGIRFGKRTPKAVMMRRLEELIDEEEQMEEQALAQAKQWRNWQAEQKEKEHAIKMAKKRSRQELANALDIAGQVYVFGVGAYGQFSADASRPHGAFKSFELVQTLWNERVIPDGPRKLKYRNSGQPVSNLSKRTKYPRRFAGTGAELQNDAEDTYSENEVNDLPGRHELVNYDSTTGAPERPDKNLIRFPAKPRSTLDKLIRGADFGIPDDSDEEGEDDSGEGQPGSNQNASDKSDGEDGDDDDDSEDDDSDDDSEDDSEDSDDDPIERARLEAQRVMELEERKYKSPFVRTICSPNTSALWGRRVVDVTAGLNTAFARTDRGELLAWGGRDQWWTPVGDENLEESRGQLTERSKLMLNMHDKSPWPDMAEPNLELQMTEEEIFNRLRLVTEDYYNVYEPSPQAHLKNQHMENVILPKLPFDKVELTLRMRGFQLEGLNKRQMVDLVYDAVRIERKIGGRKLSDKFRETEIEMLDLYRDKQSTTAKGKAELLETTARSAWRPLLKIYNEEKEQRERQRTEMRVVRENQHNKIYKKWRRSLRGISQSKLSEHLPAPIITTERGSKPHFYNDSTTGFAAVSAGAFHVGSISATTRELYTWGDGNFGRLGQGQGPKLRSRSDVQANAHRGASGSVVAAIQAAAIASETGAARYDVEKPTLVQELVSQRLVAISCGFSHSAAITEQGRVFIWGGSNDGKLGLGNIPQNVETYCPFPARLNIPNVTRIVQISCGNTHTGAVSEDGRLFMWGCSDGGRLGLGYGLPRQVQEPQLARTLHAAGVRVAQVSCGCTHTVVCERVRKKTEGEGLNRVKRVSGGHVFVAGPVAALGKSRPTFHIMRELLDTPIKRVSAGYGATACISVQGELYTWGANKSGAIAQDAERKFIRHPRLVRAMYTVPRDLALYRPSHQSSVYNSRTSKCAVNGDLSGMGETQVIHTQMDPQPYWEVDLGRICILEKIVLWNREDEPLDASAPRDHFTKRLFPCWILVGNTPFDRQLVNAYGQCAAKKKFTQNMRRSIWKLPANTAARYVRVQLETTNYLHFAELEVYGTPGLIQPISKVNSVHVGKEVMLVVCKPSKDKQEIESAYERAVRADPGNAFILRQYPTFFEAWDKIKFGELSSKCPLDRGSIRCEMCTLRTKWNDVKYPPGPGGRLRRLDSMAELLLETNPPPLNWQLIKPKLDSAAATILYAYDTVKGLFHKSSKKLLGRHVASERFGLMLHESDLGLTDYILHQMESMKKAEDEELAAQANEEAVGKALENTEAANKDNLQGRGACGACDMCDEFEPLMFNERICKVCTHPFSTHSTTKDSEKDKKKKRKKRKKRRLRNPNGLYSSMKSLSSVGSLGRQSSQQSFFDDSASSYTQSSFTSKRDADASFTYNADDSRSIAQELQGESSFASKRYTSGSRKDASSFSVIRERDAESVGSYASRGKTSAAEIEASASASRRETDDVLLASTKSMQGAASGKQLLLDIQSGSQQDLHDVSQQGQDLSILTPASSLVRRRSRRASSRISDSMKDSPTHKVLPPMGFPES